jgi:hypothetical protein
MSMNNRKAFFPTLTSVLVLGMWSWCTAAGQDYNAPGTMPPPPPRGSVPEAAKSEPKPESVDQPGTGLSSWILYDRNNCCVGQGGATPVLTEVIFRVGPSFPVGGEYFGRNVDIGWMIQGGARAMFFNQSWTKAWAVELSISNTYNPAHATADTTFLDHNINQLVSVRALDRTFVNAGIGREWYLWGAANVPDDCHLRTGVDFGGRYGAATVQFNEIRHRTQVIEGIYAAIHTDLEVPWGRWTYLAGVRGEYDFTWSNIFASGRGNMQDLLLLFNLGVRY